MLCAIFFALYDAQVDNTLWTGPRWRLLVSGNLPAAWTPNLLCSPPGLELALPAAASFSDRRIYYLAVSVVPPFVFLLGSFGRCTILIVSTSRLHCTYPTHTWHQCCICRWVTNNWCVPTCTGTLDVLPSGRNGCDSCGSRSYNRWDETKEFIKLIPRSTDRSSQLYVQIKCWSPRHSLYTNVSIVTWMYNSVVLLCRPVQQYR